MKLPYFPAYSDVTEFVRLETEKTGFSRLGQSIVNRYDVPKPLADRLYEQLSFSAVCGAIWDHFNKRGYQK